MKILNSYSPFCILITILFLTVNPHISKAQINFKFINPEKSAKHGIRLDDGKSISELKMPTYNFDPLIKESENHKAGTVPFRFGKDFNVNIDFFELANKTSKADSTIYFYKITSAGAYSLNLSFGKFYISKNASLLIYSSDKSMIYGPITNKNNPKSGVLNTDLIKGESIIIQFSVKGNDIGDSMIRIDKIVHGYINTFIGFGDSEDCNVDFACRTANGYRDVGNAVALVITGNSVCSGSLINNACQDLEPNFLTAFHCLDSDNNGVLSLAERNAVSGWVFRFLYESTYCTGGEGPTGFTVNGSTLRASFVDSDFALLLLNNIPPYDITYAGWDRSPNAATSSATVHHPAGDVKKIAFDDDPLTNISQQTVWVRDLYGNPVVVAPANSHWASNFEHGTVEPGSSGSPVFNQHGRIVGQLHGDYLNTNDDYCQNQRGQFGRFDVSWGMLDNGNFVDATRNATNSLGPWLTNDPTVTSVNQIHIPELVRSSGEGPICSSGYSGFNMIDLPATHSTTWSLTSNLIAVSQGSTSILTRYSGSGNGIATITGTIQNNNSGLCPTTRTYTYEVQAGPFTTSQVSVTGTTAVCPDTQYWYEANVPFGHLTNYTYNWAYPSNWIWPYQTENKLRIKTPMYNPQYGTVRVSVNNGCGTTSYTGVTVYPSYSCGYYYTYSPNPASEELIVTASSTSSEEAASKRMDVPIDNHIFEVVLLDSYNTIVKKKNNNKRNRVVLNIQNLERGIYFLHIIENARTIKEQIVIQ